MLDVLGWILWALAVVFAVSWTHGAAAMCQRVEWSPNNISTPKKLWAFLKWTHGEATVHPHPRGKWFPNNISSAAMMWVFVVFTFGQIGNLPPISKFHLVWMIHLAMGLPLVVWYWDARGSRQPPVRLMEWLGVAAITVYVLQHLGATTELVVGVVMTGLSVLFRYALHRWRPDAISPRYDASTKPACDASIKCPASGLDERGASLGRPASALDEGEEADAHMAPSGFFNKQQTKRFGQKAIVREHEIRGQQPCPADARGKAITYSSLGAWLCEEQLALWRALFAHNRKTEAERPDLVSLDSSPDALTGAFTCSYALGLALVLVTNEPYIDMRRFYLDAPDIDGPTLNQAAEAIHAEARDGALARGLRNLDGSQAAGEGSAADLFPLWPTLIDCDQHIMPAALGYLMVMKGGVLDEIPIPLWQNSWSFVKTIDGPPGEPRNPWDKAVLLAFWSAFEGWLPECVREIPVTALEDLEERHRQSLMQRYFTPWNHHTAHLQRRLFEAVGTDRHRFS